MLLPQLPDFAPNAAFQAIGALAAFRRRFELGDLVALFFEHPGIPIFRHRDRGI
jgi:hypothetical protein